MARKFGGSARQPEEALPDSLKLNVEDALSALEADTLRLAAIVESSDDAIISKQLDGTITTWNAGAERLFGYTAEEIIGQSVLLLIPADRQDEEGGIVQRIRRGERVEHFETIRQHKTGKLIDISLTVSPIKRPDGSIIGASKIARDITQKKRSDELLHQQAERLAVLNRVARIISQDLDLDRIVQAVTDEATAIIGARYGAFFHNIIDDAGEKYQLCSLSGAPRGAFEVTDLPCNTAIFGPTFSGNAIARSEDLRQDRQFTLNSPHDGDRPVVSYLAVPVTSGSGKVIGALIFGHEEPGRFGPEAETLVVAIAAQAAVAIDNAHLHKAAQIEIAQRKEAQIAKDLLLHEVKHRVKNTLATIQALASQTLKQTPPQEKAAFIKRLHSLSDAHDLLTQSDWNSVGIAMLAQQSLSPFTGIDAGRVVLTGPDVGLSPNKALILTMVLHELGTNAIKYGSLSAESGRVEVQWHLDPDTEKPDLRLTWRESGGPAVADPEHRGFGSRMIVSALHGNEGSVNFDYCAKGLEVELAMRL